MWGVVLLGVGVGGRCSVGVLNKIWKRQDRIG